MDRFGTKISNLRKSRNVSQDDAAGYLHIDIALFNRIENGEEKLNREQVMKLASYFTVPENDLLLAWVSDNLMHSLEDKEIELQAFELGEGRVEYVTKYKTGTENMLSLIQTILENDGRVSAAWLFGSISRGEHTTNSDVDIMVEFNNRKKYSMFDLLDIAFLIEKKIKRKVDLVEKGYLKDFALKTATHDLIKIYG